MTERTIPTTYDPHQVENKWYSHWENNGFFHAEVELDKPPVAIVMPPPNVTGTLHLGHALDNTLQDILTRWRRMQGYNALWIPGTDHAGIATQARVEENLAKEGISKHDLGREKFLERVWAWKHQYGNTITRQLRKLGASSDWSRERFTMDEGCSRAVQEVFVRLYEKGLIYRGNYIINWCPKCMTTISDIEVEHQEQAGQLYYIKYPVVDSDEFVIVATTRPETMLGDTAVAVNPGDERYAKFIGRSLLLPVVNREIPVISDEFVEMGFGTGAVKVTPAHDPNDFEMGLRHNLEQVNVLNKDATMNALAGKYADMDRYTCREALVKDLEDISLLVKIEEHAHAVGQCYRCDTTVEPMVSRQWFVRMKPLAEPAIQAVVDSQIKFVPERFTKIYLNWMENIRDWCISRQLWWGHRIPVWYCQTCGEQVCAKDEPALCSKCGSKDLQQDPDVLDTWFSSALWPFSTLGWPEQTLQLQHFYPTTVLVTGRDIIFFWVARMIFMGLAFMEDVPFGEVFIHGLVLDPQGRKMSKSLGNGIDPVEVIEQYGADTLRFMLVTGNTPGNDLRFHFERLEATRNFANKIWNASRFAMLNLTDYQEDQAAGLDTAVIAGNWDEIRSRLSLQPADRWIISRFNRVASEVDRYLESYELGEAARTLYDFIWNEFCDWYIELAKPHLYGKITPESKVAAQWVIQRVLSDTLKLLHPFMPFITEEIWQHLPHRGPTIMLADWPAASDRALDVEAEEILDLVMGVIRSVRNIRSEINVPPGKKAELILVSAKAEQQARLRAGLGCLETLAMASKIDILPLIKGKPTQAAVAIVSGIEIYVPLKDLIDLDKEVARLEKDIQATDKELAKLDGKLNNPAFLDKAPPEIVAKEQAKQEEFRARRQALQERVAVLRG